MLSVTQGSLQNQALSQNPNCYCPARVGNRLHAITLQMCSQNPQHRHLLPIWQKRAVLCAAKGSSPLLSSTATSQVFTRQLMVSCWFVYITPGWVQVKLKILWKSWPSQPVWPLLKDPVRLGRQSQPTSYIKTSPQKCPEKHQGIVQVLRIAAWSLDGFTPICRH